MRFIIIEPFLRRAEGHFIELACALEEGGRRLFRVEVEIVGHTTVDDHVKALLPRVIAGATHTAFEAMDDDGESFATDLRALDSKLVFGPDDLLIVCTAWEKQLLGISHYLKGLNGSIPPQFALLFHQLLPPVGASSNVHSTGFRRYWISRLRTAFRSAADSVRNSSANLSYWTTESTRLNRDFKRIANTNVGMLPLPLNRVSHGNHSIKSLGSGARMRFGFLGQGRQEKGLIKFLEAAHSANARGLPIDFVVQLYDLRGYTPPEQDLLSALCSDEAARDMEVIRGSLPPGAHQELLCSLDAVILPGDPANYHRRISGLLVQAAASGIPVVASSGTWAAEMIHKQRAAGVVFEYDPLSNAKTVENLASGYEELTHSYGTYWNAAQTTATYFDSRCTCEHFFEPLLATHRLCRE